jgi:hypothetical protein
MIRTRKLRLLKGKTKMRKRLITPTSTTVQYEPVLDLNAIATVEVTSEEKGFPIEFSLLPEHAGGWRAAQPGIQSVRLLFDKRQTLRRISLVFEEEKVARTQEFVLRWSSDGEGPLRELVRQQWNFSPPTTVREVEDYRVELSDVAVLELSIIPDINGGAACASLKSLRLS